MMLPCRLMAAFRLTTSGMSNKQRSVMTLSMYSPLMGFPSPSVAGTLATNLAGMLSPVFGLTSSNMHNGGEGMRCRACPMVRPLPEPVGPTRATLTLSVIGMSCGVNCATTFGGVNADMRASITPTKP